MAAQHLPGEPGATHARTGATPEEHCDHCGAATLVWRKCKQICASCAQINKSCADL